MVLGDLASPASNRICAVAFRGASGPFDWLARVPNLEGEAFLPGEDLPQISGCCFQQQSGACYTTSRYRDCCPSACIEDWKDNSVVAQPHLAHPCVVSIALGRAMTLLRLNCKWMLITLSPISGPCFSFVAASCPVVSGSDVPAMICSELRL